MKKKYLAQLSARERAQLTGLIHKGKVTAYRRTHAQILLRKCLNRRLPYIDRMRSEVNAWVEVRNGVGNTTNWRFTTEDTRIKLRSLYPAKLN